MLSNGQAEAAMPVLQEWEAIEPGNAELRKYREMLDHPTPPATGDHTDQQQAEEAATGRVYRVDQGTDAGLPGVPQSPNIAQDKSKGSLSTSEE